jgi:uncharacterized membrane protein
MIGAYAGATAWSQNSRDILLDGSTQPMTLRPSDGMTASRTVAVTVIWLFGNFLYVDYSFAFSIGHPFRQAFIYNPWLVLALIGSTVCNLAWYWVQTGGVRTFFFFFPFLLIAPSVDQLLVAAAVAVQLLGSAVWHYLRVCPLCFLLRNDYDLRRAGLGGAQGKQRRVNRFTFFYIFSNCGSSSVT